MAEIELAARQGRCVRPSGTEPLVRVMVEAPTAEQAAAVADRLVARWSGSSGEPSPAPDWPTGSRGPPKLARQRPEWLSRIREVAPRMCGIIGVTRRPSDRLAPSSAEILAPRRAGARAARPTVGLRPRVARVIAGRPHRRPPTRLLRGVPGVEALLADRSLGPALDALLTEVGAMVATIEARPRPRRGAALARPRGGQRRARPAQGRRRGPCGRDRLRTAREVADLAGPDPSRAAIAGYTSIQVALSALDRLEVRGRDSAGIHVLVRDHDLDLELARPSPRSSPPARATRCSRPTSVRAAGDALSFVYKAAAEIGELGDNTRGAPRPTSAATRCCSRRSPASAAAGASCSATPAGRASASSPQPNAHPLNAEELDRVDGPVRGRRAQRRRRQLRRPQDQRAAAHRRPRSPPTPRSSPRSCPGGSAAVPTSTRPSGARWPASTARSPSRPARPTRPPTCCSPSGAAARRSTSAWPTA